MNVKEMIDHLNRACDELIEVDITLTNGVNNIDTPTRIAEQINHSRELVRAALATSRAAIRELAK